MHTVYAHRMYGLSFIRRYVWCMVVAYPSDRLSLEILGMLRTVCIYQGCYVQCVFV